MHSRKRSTAKPSKPANAWKIAGTAGSTVAPVAAKPAPSARGNESRAATTGTPRNNSGVTRFENP